MSESDHFISQKELSKLIERRFDVDRRAFVSSPDFPLIDRLRGTVWQDRRKQPDRRLSNIEVKFIPFGKRRSRS